MKFVPTILIAICELMKFKRNSTKTENLLELWMQKSSFSTNRTLNYLIRLSKYFCAAKPSVLTWNC